MDMKFWLLGVLILVAASIISRAAQPENRVNIIAEIVAAMWAAVMYVLWFIKNKSGTC